jgi:S1-C subfamily serine protease
VAVGGVEVTTVDGLIPAVEGHADGVPLAVTAVRGADEITFEVSFESPPAAEAE